MKTSVLYKDFDGVSLDVNLKGDLFYATKDGQIYRTPADHAGDSTLESEYFANVQSLFYKANELFFWASDGN